MTRILAFIAAVAAALAALAAPATVDNVPNVHLADARRYVSNPDAILSPQAVDSLDRAIGNLSRATTAELVVIAVDSVDPSTTPHDLAYQILQKWGVGKADVNNGIVLLISRADRRVEIVTGRGVEGVIPDVIASRITDQMAPAFRQGNFDAGAAIGVNWISRILTDPAAADEIRSSASSAGRADDGRQFTIYIAIVLGILLILIILTISRWRSTAGLDVPRRTAAMRPLYIALLMASFITLGIGLPAFLILRHRLRSLRLRPRRCPNCDHIMHRLPEDLDNRYLNPAQDLEEQLNSVDYDVWLCPQCHETDIIPFINDRSAYTECPRCHARALALVADRHIPPSAAHPAGRGVRVYRCRNCGNIDNRYYTISDPAAGAAAGAILGGVIGGLSGGGGSFGGGGGTFGGGSSAGGGAGSSW